METCHSLIRPRLYEATKLASASHRAHFRILSHVFLAPVYFDGLGYAVQAATKVGTTDACSWKEASLIYNQA